MDEIDDSDSTKDAASSSSEAARQLSKLGASKGGNARGRVLSKEERTEIARSAVKERWRRYYESKGLTSDELAKAKSKRETEKTKQARIELVAKATDDDAQPPYSLLRGEIAFGDLKLECHVLSDYRRVITQSEFVRVLTGGTATNFSRYLANNPLIARGISHSLPIRFNIAKQTMKAPLGFEVTALIETCDQFLAARATLSKSQLPMAIRAEIIMRACAKVGIVALVDEATGFQQIREKNALRLKLQAFISEDLQEWARMFPDDFWIQLARLEGIRYHPNSRPLRWGKYVMAFVYDAIDKDIGKELRSKNPKPRHRRNHHQWLKEFGRDKVHDQITGVIAIMKSCDSFEEFQRKFGKVFKKQDPQGQLMDWLEPS